VIIACLGFSPRLEGEEGEVAASDGGGDRRYVHLPGVQQELLEMLCTIGKPVVLVTTGGSAIGMNWAAENVPAIVHLWYPGEEGGTALADVLFGDYNPAGRLPVTFVKSLDDVPPFGDYSMKGRTYRYMETEPLFPFGFGLSYTEFEYGSIKLSSEKIGTQENLEVSVDVRNTGDRKGDEVVQLYLRQPNPPFTVPLRRLQGIERITLGSAETKTVSFLLTPRDLAAIDDDGNCVLIPGQFEVFVGGCQPDPRSEALTGKEISVGRFKVTGSPRHLEY
jgi:beta-glucosidase